MLPVLSKGEADLTACFSQDMAALLESFSEKDTSSKQSLQQMLAADRGAFSRASMRVLAQAGATASAPGAGARYVVHLLRKENLLTETLADPHGSRQEDAVAAARVVSQISTTIAADLERMLGGVLSQSPSPATTTRVLRLLDVLEAAAPQPRFYLFQTELMSYPDSGVRSQAALLIARTSKSAALVSRWLLDDDAGVQANAVEALWTFDAADARPLLLNASRSKIARVAANAAVGLYRIGDLSSLRLMFAMAEHENEVQRSSAAWAMGETGDPRLLPFLTSWFPRTSSNERVNVLQALGRIRRREKQLAECGAIDIRIWSATAEGSNRSLSLSLQCADNPELTALRPTDFAIWEGGTLVHDYEISVQPNPALAICGFVLPRFASTADPYAMAVLEGIERCLPYKRADDLWRVDRYLPDPRLEAAPPLEKAALPYDESLLGGLAKSHQRGFLSPAEALRKIVESPGSRERAADNIVIALDRQSDAMIKFSGKRRLFVFLSSNGGGCTSRQMARLTSFAGNERITLHGIAPKSATISQEICDEFRAFCAASEGGSFAELAIEDVAAEVEQIYAQSMNRFNVSYRLTDAGAPAGGSVLISSDYGCGRAAFSF
jgi:hypothetical protein